jgi:hypothetical protein
MHVSYATSPHKISQEIIMAPCSRLSSQFSNRFPVLLHAKNHVYQSNSTFQTPRYFRMVITDLLLAAHPVIHSVSGT